MVKCFGDRGELVPAISHSINRAKSGNWSGLFADCQRFNQRQERILYSFSVINCRLMYCLLQRMSVTVKDHCWWGAHKTSAAAFRELSKMYCLVIINYPSINDKCSRKSTQERSCSKEKSKSLEGANVLEHLQKIDSTSKSSDLIHMKVVEGW